MLILETIDTQNYSLFEEELIKLYLEAFTTGENAQYIAEEQAKKTLKDLIEIGFGVVAKQNSKIAGLLLAYPLRLEEEFPEWKLSNPEFENALYIAEVLVGESFRGQGVASEMLKSIRDSAFEKKYNSLVLRVWEENKRALNLYKKSGFTDTSVEINQIKYKNEKTPFVMRKIYLSKKIR